MSAASRRRRRQERRSGLTAAWCGRSREVRSDPGMQRSKERRQRLSPSKREAETGHRAAWVGEGSANTARSHGGSSHWWTGLGRKARELLQRSLSSGSKGMADCPVPEGPMITEAEMRTQAHVRIERGTRCFLSGRCRLPNSYLYDKEIIPRVAKAILADGRFADTSVWAEGQRRWVWLKGS